MYRRTFKKAEQESDAPIIPSRAFPTMAMTVDDMAEELHISRPTAYELVKQEGFPSFTLGRRVLVNREGLQRWLDKQCEAKAA